VLGTVADACNPSHSGGRDQEDLGSRPARATSSALSKKAITKKKKMHLNKSVSSEKAVISALHTLTPKFRSTQYKDIFAFLILHFNNKSIAIF
jgi:hypothetical protein